MLHEVAEFENVILSCGGGTPCFFDNMDYMNSLGETVYLKASPEVLAAHLRMGKGIRPLLQGKSPEELEDYVRTSLAEREKFYLQAKHVFDVSLMDSIKEVDKSVVALRQQLGI